MSEQLPANDVDVLLAAAVAAPSMHNTQPWRFEVEGHVVDVYLDGSRTLPAEDPTGRAMRIAAGAATFNLRCAAETLGYGTWFGLAPYPAEEPDLLARIVVEPTAARNDELFDLARYIPHRHTDRRPSDAVPIAEGVRVELMRAAYSEGAELIWLGDDQVRSVLDLVLETDLREIRDWQRRSERAHWVGGDRSPPARPRPVARGRRVARGRTTVCRVRLWGRGRRPIRAWCAISAPDRRTGSGRCGRSSRTRISPYCRPPSTNPPTRSPRVPPSSGSC